MDALQRLTENKMKILEYNDIDPLQVLNLTLLALDFPLTPEHAAHIRRTGPRPFPCFTVNALEDDVVLGQGGVFRMLKIDIKALQVNFNAAEAIAAAASKLKTSYVQVTLSRPSDIANFQGAGWQAAHPNWNAFMVKPLVPQETADKARRLFGIGAGNSLSIRSCFASTPDGVAKPQPNALTVFLCFQPGPQMCEPI